MKIPNRCGGNGCGGVSLARIVSEDSQQLGGGLFFIDKSSKDS